MVPPLLHQLQWSLTDMKQSWSAGQRHLFLKTWSPGNTWPLPAGLSA
ncbi:rCG40393 [Rattus norvegicus]|uniref:RCG40393 n=1 Tax=Rattus norvegicus TaxID=10116 RepID=A6IA24_RAT|nr:rCG40393 [Rattus norvegicus]